MLKLLISIDKNPYIIHFAEKSYGKIFILLIYAIFMHQIPLFSNYWQQVVLTTCAFISFFPKYRYLFLFIGMFGLLLEKQLIAFEPDWFLFKLNYFYLEFLNNYHGPLTSSNIKMIDLFIIILFSELLIYFSKRSDRYKFAKHPVALFYVLLLILIFCAMSLPLTKLQFFILWSFIAIYNHYFWFIGYSIIESRTSAKRNIILDYARYLPIWGFTALPYGKGSNYLRRVEAKNSEEFAITQLKAVKLTCWAFLLHLLLNLMHQTESYFSIPTLPKALADYAQGNYYSIQQAWLCLFDRFFRSMLGLTVTGHLVVATCRLCGFKILRNTYKPLQSQSVAEYWNRYNFYFKELLVEFFFYPAYFNYFKNYKKFRIFFATICAATFGNILFHFLLITPILMSTNSFSSLYGFVPYIFYSVVLGVSIGISQLRQMHTLEKPNRIKQYFISPLLVLSFYAILSLFNQPYQSQSIQVNFIFLLSLFNFTGYP